MAKFVKTLVINGVTESVPALLSAVGSKLGGKESVVAWMELANIQDIVNSMPDEWVICVRKGEENYRQMMAGDIKKAIQYAVELKTASDKAEEIKENARREYEAVLADSREKIESLMSRFVKKSVPVFTNTSAKLSQAIKNVKSKS